MKARPNFDADAFLSGAKADRAPNPKTITIPAPPAKIAREQKVFRLPVTLTEDLKMAAFKLSVAQNRRVTETEIVEIAIRAFIDSQDS